MRPVRQRGTRGARTATQNNSQQQVASKARRSLDNSQLAAVQRDSEARVSLQAEPASVRSLLGPTHQAVTTTGATGMEVNLSNVHSFLENLTSYYYLSQFEYHLYPYSS